MLILSDSWSFVDRGGVIALDLVGDRVHFDLNLATVRSANPRINSQVLKFAQQVVEPKGML